MQFEITNKFTGEVQITADINCDENAEHSVKLGMAVKWAYKNDAYLRGADFRDANLRGANLGGANLGDADFRCAYLRGADFRGAYLGDADFRGANLGDADFRGAYLRGADFRGAYLRGAKNLNKHAVTPLLMLLDQPGKIRAYKLVNGGGEGPIKSGLKYEVGQSASVNNANCDEFAQCAAGINVATADWCIREWVPGNRILIVEFKAQDIACIPTATDGKFRLWSCDVVAEADLGKFGLAAPEADEASQ